MEARPDPASANSRRPSRSPLAPSELGPVLSCLTRELDGPLAALRSSLDALAADPVVASREELRVQLSLMRDLGQGLSSLNRDYFDFAAVTEGVLAPRPRPTRLADLLSPIDRQFRPAAVRQGVGWECRLDGPDAVVATDQAWCRRLIRGLVSNALRFTPSGGRVGLIAASQDRSGWVLTVRDTGPGLPPGLSLPEVAPFRRARENFERSDGEAEGNKLGLPLVLALVARLGGHASFASKAGQGTCVEIHFSDSPEPIR